MPIRANKHLAIGHHYERLALNYLQGAGLIFVCKNVRFSVGEIDLIMKDDEQIVFVEVKFRADYHYGGAISSVTPSKQKRLTKTAMLWLQQQNLVDKYSCRFDLVAISYKGNDLHYDWLKNIFQ